METFLPLMREEQVHGTTLHSPNVSTHISAEDLKIGFEEKFGKIETVKFIDEKPAVGQQHLCLITFEKAEDAARAIREHTVHIKGSLVRVFDVDTWHQTNQHTSVSSAESCEEPIECTLTRKLNADCIYEILRYLTTVEICNFKVAFSYYANVCDAILQNRLKYFDMKISERNYVLQVAGNVVKHIKIDTIPFPNGCSCLNSLPRFCPNLEKLEILEFDWSKFILTGSSSSVFPKLTALHLERMQSDGDDALNRIGKSIKGQIKELILKNNTFMTGEPLKLFKKLKSLTIEHCNEMTAMYIEDCLKQNCNTLKEIDLINYGRPLFCHRLGNIIAEKMPNLEVLRINETYQDKHTLSFNNFTNLKTLTFNYSSYHFSENEFCKIYDTLQELSIGCQKSGVSVLKILLNFSKLKVLELFFGYYPNGFLPNLNGKFVHLEEFQLSKCINTNETELLDFIKSHNKLHTIHIKKCNRVVKESLLNDCQQFLEQEQDYRPNLKFTVTDSHLDMLRTGCHSRIQLELLDEGFYEFDDPDYDIYSDSDHFSDDGPFGKFSFDMTSGTDMNTNLNYQV